MTRAAAGTGMRRALLEICAETPAGVDAALSGGADRIELVSALALGGLTPSPGFMRLAKESGIPTMAMIRPRAGSFVFDEDEIALMLGDIAEVRAHGLAGVVLGAARSDGTLDTDVLMRLVAAAGPLQTGLHRVFDLTPDPFAALEQAVEIGFSRILTSGQKPRAPQGLDLIAALQARAAGRITIMPGGGIRLSNVGTIVRATGSTEIHASCMRDGPPAEVEHVRFGFAPPGPRRIVDPEAVAEMRRRLAAIAAPDPDVEMQPIQ